ncbi:hypothetical protein D5018_19755 [Parashewanella curva]|uniref:Cell division protein FtsL n=1 Tax=Parashewanella curva TaxID=2338552 RepID=A0A3L8PRW0_9GAMM|nr:hypothetical protein [Parashewanella curva]RLV57964.1 hypothetical protein D5018_19755 [Parashewanella curva]
MLKIVVFAALSSLNISMYSLPKIDVEFKNHIETQQSKALLLKDIEQELKTQHLQMIDRIRKEDFFEQGLKIQKVSFPKIKKVDDPNKPIEY